jgi:hypothetical protein
MMRELKWRKWVDVMRSDKDGEKEGVLINQVSSRPGIF